MARVDGADAWGTARRVLTVRLGTLGSVLMTTPAIRALRVAGPADRTVTLLTSRLGAGLAPLLPDVDDALVYDPPPIEDAAGKAPAPDVAQVKALRSRAFDAAVLFTGQGRSALPAARLCRLAGIPLRLGYGREDPDGLLTHRVPGSGPESVRHEVRRQLDLVAAVGADAGDGPLRLSLSRDAQEHARRLLAAAGVDLGASWIVVHPGASAPARRYPAWSYAEVVRRLVARDDLQVVVTGDDEEVELAADLAAAAGHGVVTLAGRTTLELFAAVISQSGLLVGNNAGPIHIAAALGVPVVDLYALTTPGRTPWLVPSRVLSHDVPCRWCRARACPMSHHLCLRGVEPETVVHAVGELLRTTDD
jgi:lipopolysaccharide heptosyltransferase II